METKIEEIWKDTDFQGYQISNLGNVRSIDRLVPDSRGHFRKRKGQLICGGMDRNSYCIVVLSVDNIQTTTSKHILVAKAFIPNPENKRCVNHKNSIRTDNRVENLEWVTHKENSKHGIESGYMLKGEDIPWSKLTESEVHEIKSASGFTQLELAKRFNVSRTLICLIRGNKRWTHLQKA